MQGTPILGNVLLNKCCFCGTMLEAWREVLGLLRSWVAQRAGPDMLLLPLLPLRSWSWDLDAFLAAGLEVGVVQATCASCSL